MPIQKGKRGEGKKEAYRRDSLAFERDLFNIYLAKPVAA